MTASTPDARSGYARRGERFIYHPGPETGGEGQVTAARKGARRFPRVEGDGILAGLRSALGHHRRSERRAAAAGGSGRAVGARPGLRLPGAHLATNQKCQLYFIPGNNKAVSAWQVDLVRFYGVDLVRQGGRRRGSGAGSADLVRPLKVDQVHPERTGRGRGGPGRISGCRTGRPAGRSCRAWSRAG